MAASRPPVRTVSHPATAPITAYVHEPCTSANSSACPPTAGHGDVRCAPIVCRIHPRNRYSSAAACTGTSATATMIIGTNVVQPGQVNESAAAGRATSAQMPSHRIRRCPRTDESVPGLRSCVHRTARKVSGSSRTKGARSSA
ncbi:hypothetical protein GCM10009539_85240 [Cryptosporangium japonicum]|uniref:Uncharacterized protein n=1 Tax=Cryptosporangium japonicum TaxID=80872 RepID=A0ABN0VBA2_9ACTN